MHNRTRPPRLMFRSTAQEYLNPHTFRNIRVAYSNQRSADRKGNRNARTSKGVRLMTRGFLDCNPLINASMLHPPIWLFMTVPLTWCGRQSGGGRPLGKRTVTHPSPIRAYSSQRPIGSHDPPSSRIVQPMSIPALLLLLPTSLSSLVPFTRSSFYLWHPLPPSPPVQFRRCSNSFNSTRCYVHVSYT